MKKIGAIVAMNEQKIIGVDGDLPWHYSDDLKRFKRETINSTIIMGRITWLSLRQKALPNRRNIVITSQKLDGVEHYKSIEEAIKQARIPLDESIEKSNTIWIIGGGQLYKSALPLIDFFDLTFVPDIIDESKHEKVTKFFNFDEDEWKAGAVIANPNNEKLKHQRIVRR